MPRSCFNYQNCTNGNPQPACGGFHNPCSPRTCQPKPCPTRPRCCGCIGLVGPTGPTGAAGAAILGSYATYAEFIAAHPTGTPGDAYLVGGVLYVWNGETAAWSSMGSMIGPTGPTGAAGATILGSYDTYEELKAAHPTGTPGDAYLVNGVLYVWDGATRTWRSMGSLIGPTGPTGAAGATILGSYETYADLIAEHPTGTPGDAYLVDGELYVWDGETGTWRSMGSLIGPTGPTGAAGATILGSYDTYASLIAEHPTGTPGDAYLVDGVLYVWDGETGSWRSMGSLIGPTGPQGSVGNDGADGIIGSIDGVVDTQAELPTTGIEQGTIYYVVEDNGLYLWDDATGNWTQIDVAQGPRGATGPTI